MGFHEAEGVSRGLEEKGHMKSLLQRVGEQAYRESRGLAGGTGRPPIDVHDHEFKVKGVQLIVRFSPGCCLPGGRKRRSSQCVSSVLGFGQRETMQAREERQLIK